VKVLPLRVNFWPDVLTKPVDEGGAEVEVVDVAVVDVAVVDVDVVVVVDLVVLLDAVVEPADPGMHYMWC
jgi:hypothetical protein